MENILRIDFDTFTCNSAGEPIEGTGITYSILFNTNVISEEEVIELINASVWEYDNRIIITTPTRADTLKV
jgi:hypothetical protein